MLESTQADPPLHCIQCSYEANWTFQLNSHIQRNHHRNVDTVVPFHALAEPELHPCMLCGFNNYCKLSLYEHCSRHHENTSVKVENTETSLFIQETSGKYKTWLCSYCKDESASLLSFIKHRQYFCNGKELEETNEQRIIFVDVPMNVAKAKQIISTDVLMNDAFQCGRCAYKAKTETLLKQHTSNHSKHSINDKISWFKCSKCSYHAKKEQLKKHYTLNHAAADIGNEANTGLRFQCAKCSYRGKTKDNLVMHMLTHAEGEEVQWFCCTKCSYRSKRKYDLKSHMSKHAAVVNDNIGLFNCEQCSYRAKIRGTMRRHMLKHADREEIIWYNCMKCSYRCKERNTLGRHIISKHAAPEEINWWCCTKCSYRAKLKGQLKNHMLRHAGKWLQCTECSFQAKYGSGLKRHMLKHVTSK